MLTVSLNKMVDFWRVIDLRKAAANCYRLREDNLCLGGIGCKVYSIPKGGGEGFIDLCRNNQCSIIIFVNLTSLETFYKHLKERYILFLIYIPVMFFQSIS